MFEKKTLFVVGAGAGAEVGLPVGTQLAGNIAKALDFEFEYGEMTAGDRELHRALRLHCGPRDFNSYADAARLISQGITLVRSIDNFIDSHRSAQSVAACGKIAIAHQMLLAEAGSSLRWQQTRRGDVVELLDADQTWYGHFARMLVSNVPASGYEQLFANVSFVSFNYDRTIEQFLRSWLATLTGAPAQEMEHLLASLEILRPYGSLGPLWGNHGIRFGANPQQGMLPTIGDNIRTYTEQVLDVDLLETIEDRICECETIVFLGFHFHEQNMRLLSPDRPTKIRRVFATAHGFSDADAENIRGTLAYAYRPRPKSEGGFGAADPRIFVRNDLRCSGLFHEYQRSLRS